MLAFAMLAAIRHQANAMTPQKTKPGKARSWPLKSTSSAGRFRKSAASPSDLPNGEFNPLISSHDYSGEEPTELLQEKLT